VHWILADLIMFVCSVGVYVAVRKAALDKLPPQFNSLAMFAIPVVIFAIGDIVAREKMGLTLSQALQIIGTGVALAYLGSAMSMRSIQLAPNAGYSLTISKSYVVLTSFLAVPLFGARLTTTAIISIALIVAASALIMINPKAAHHAKSAAWVPLAVGSFFCWAFLSLMAKHFTAEGIATVVFLSYVFFVATACILIEMGCRGVKFGVVKQHRKPFILIGIASTGFNFFNFYAVSIAPNVGYVNATNAASISAVTILSVILFGDELTKRKLVGTLGVLVGLVALFVWK
jgi:drug/metabolite transporter (DMT)-like permease